MSLQNYLFKTLALLLNNVKCELNLNICYDYDEDPTLEIIKKDILNINI